MSFLKKILGQQPTPPAAEAEAAPVSDPAQDPNLIRAYDAYGREIFVTREQWRENVLAGAIEQHWNDADSLSGLIIQSLGDGFADDMLKPAERLIELEPGAERAVVLLAIVYMKTSRLDDSERVLLEFMRQHGETGVTLTNLAKIQDERGDEAGALATLWRALEHDPNQENGLGWYEAIHREHGGDVAGVTAMRKVAALPGSWRAQLWLAHAELGAHNLAGAIKLYQEALARAGSPTPAGLLMQMSADLGNAGAIEPILQLAGPRFDAAAHGVMVGNNLIRAHAELGQYDQARRILEQLYAQQRPDWQENLSYWDTELARATLGDGTLAEPDQMRFAMLLGRGPVWLAPESPAAKLFDPIPPNRPLVSFLGGSAEIGNAPDHAERQLADATGRLSRALPLYFNEQLALRCGLRTQTLVPWLTQPDPGFVLSGAAWDDADAIRYAQQCEAQSDFVVISHLVTTAEPWQAHVRVLRTDDEECIGTVSARFPMAEPAAALQQLTEDLVALIARAAALSPKNAPANYTVPDGASFPRYLLRLEQLLAVRCNGADDSRPGQLNGEREIIDGNIRQCLDFPHSLNVRLLLAQTVRAMKQLRPDVVQEFEEKIARLQREQPLPPEAQAAVQALLA
ncbi:tetratricopeptide repeat protein [Achromobacter sp. UMC71]|uniref:tetratricopeptide repeat protein n=1 Tax=Achromobacter sp. UMC71 TaxID=1862320 RepID=UPI001600AB88|nr:tetratricopeptide repeat protein [Achromobacter sp. UMC71]